MTFRRRIFPALLAFNLFLCACAYIVLPEGLEDSVDDANAEDLVWTGFVTNVGETESGDLHVDITIRNDTGDWSTMRAVENKPAVLISGDGARTNCDTVEVGTGGHRLAPGFQIRGYTKEENGQPQTQLLYVECQGASAGPGSKLLIDTVQFDGNVDYYVEIEEENKQEGGLELNLDEIVTELTYPVASLDEDLLPDDGLEITGLSENVVSLLEVQRSDSGLQFTWENSNPSKFALKTHIGIPPVVGEDGIIYGVYKTLDIPEVPLTPAQGSVEWTTEVAVPQEVGGLIILLSVESNKPRTYINYAVEITKQ